MDKYELVKIVTGGKKKFTVTIVADSNDADYITTIQEYTEEEFNLIVDELINIQKNYSGHQQLENYAEDEEYTLFDEDTNTACYAWINIPSGEWGKCHTLKSIDITCLTEDGVLYNVELNLEEA